MGVPESCSVVEMGTVNVAAAAEFCDGTMVFNTLLLCTVLLEVDVVVPMLVLWTHNQG